MTLPGGFTRPLRLRVEAGPLPAVLSTIPDLRNDDHDLSCVKKVAINQREEFLCYFDDSCDIHTLFPFCKELFIVLQHKALADNDVHFFHTEDDDLATFDYTEEARRIYWEDIKTNISTNYGRVLKCDALDGEDVASDISFDSFDNSFDLSESDMRKIPSIHAVEVVPIRTKT
ncbi:hypothetical protein F53441_2527 [Fusarium austroafricanum]|uniref:Uncharacterized protein n=1 Tax=Fusarium austroafricanum TaxID=2364996 RepID=A0A8H4P2U5_9HYPO|nr:hypothetical protein F53441_2527 [Fusarium austroafricanum]